MTELWILLLSLIVLTAIISLAEAALSHSKRSKLEPSLKKGSKSARFVLENLGRQNNIHKSLQLFQLVFIFIYGTAFVPLLREVIIFCSQTLLLFSHEAIPAGFLISLLPQLFLMHLLGFLIPQRIAVVRPEPIAIFMAPAIRLMHRIAQPFIWVTSSISNLVFKILGLPKINGDSQVTEEEVIEMIAQGTSSGTIEEVEQDMLERVLLLGDRSVASLMTNRIEVEWLDVNDPAEKILKMIIESNHSLFPVCDDEVDKVVGILNSKKFLVATQQQKTPALRSLLEKARIIPENMKALTALEEFKANKTKIAIVVDEYGAVQGLITQSDLFDSIVAEHNLPDDENEISIIQRNENSFLVDALLPFEEFLQYFEVDDVAAEDRTGFHSLGGFILHLSKEIPSTGDSFFWKNFQLEVVDMDGNRIDKILITILNKKED
jgi:putative hemolysin